MTLTNTKPERLIHESEAARLLAVSPRTLRNWRVIGNGPAFIKISGRCVRYRQTDIESFIEQKSRKNTSDQDPKLNLQT